MSCEHSGRGRTDGGDWSCEDEGGADGGGCGDDGGGKKKSQKKQRTGLENIKNRCDYNQRSSSSLSLYLSPSPVDLELSPFPVDLRCSATPALVPGE